jgi:hypothetical protein
MIEKKKVVYITIPRKLMIAFISVDIALFVGIIASYQYTNYVSRQLCGVITISDDFNKKNPSPLPAQQAMAKEFTRIRKSYHCK